MFGKEIQLQFDAISDFLNIEQIETMASIKKEDRKKDRRGAQRRKEEEEVKEETKIHDYAFQLLVLPVCKDGNEKGYSKEKHYNESLDYFDDEQKQNIICWLQTVGRFEIGLKFRELK